jgi:hypothetical protein
VTAAIAALPVGITIGTTTITSGTNGRLLYDASGVIGEMAIGSGLAVSGATLSIGSDVALSGNPTTTTQTAGNNTTRIATTEFVTTATTGPIPSSGYTMSTGKLLGRGTASTGAIEEITLGTNLSLSGTTLSANDTSVAIGEITGLGTGVATFLATPSSANLRAAVTDESGTGALLFAGGNIGAATGTSLALTGAITASNLPIVGATTADWTIPNEAWGAAPTGGVAVVAGTYLMRMLGVLSRVSGADYVLAGINSNESLGGPAYTDGPIIYQQTGTVVSAPNLTTLSAISVTDDIGTNLIVSFEGCVTFTEAGTFKWAAAASGATDVVKLLQGAFIQLIPI